MARSSIPTCALYIRIPVSLRERIDAELARVHNDDRRWGVDLKTLITERLEVAFPAPAPATKAKATKVRK
jgi:hypothetical protein